MNEHWSSYRKHLRFYIRLLPLGLPIALVPFFFNFDYWQKEGGIITGLIVAFCYGVTIPLTITALFAAVYAVLTMIAARTGRFRPMPFPFYVAVGTLGTMAGIWLSLFINSLILNEPMQKNSLLPSLVFGGFAIVMFSLYFAYRQAKEDALQLKVAVAESRYNALEHQMRPHFLFNSLNSLAELIESKNESAADVAYKLSDLYRRILANSKLKTATIESEIEIAREYLELEKVRFGSRLSYSINVAEAASGIFVPSLMIQTLAENAVKHGISKTVAGGNITIEILDKASGFFQLTVANTGAAFDGSESDGTGLANTLARLNLLYGDRHEFHIGPDETGRTVARFYFSGEKID